MNSKLTLAIKSKDINISNLDDGEFSIDSEIKNIRLEKKELEEEYYDFRIKLEQNVDLED